MPETPVSDSVTVAPSVLARLIRVAACEVPGVARMAPLPRTHLLLATSETGVGLKVSDGSVSVVCALIAAADTNLLELGTAVQATVATVIQDFVGMSVRDVHVYIQDVEANYG